MNQRKVGELVVRTSQDRQSMGAAATEDIAADLRLKLRDNKKVRMIFASAPSQSEMLEHLVSSEGIDWSCITALTAVTLTLPRLLRTDQSYCVVPGAQKKAAVNAALYGPLSTECPASKLRTHPNCTLYLDKESDPDD